MPKWLTFQNVLAFVAISIGIGAIVAGILYWWHARRPITEKDIDNEKKPLGLS